MKLLHWTALPAVITSLVLSSCSGERTQTAEPLPSPAPSAPLAPTPVAKATGTVLRKEQTLNPQQVKATKQIFQQATVLEKQGRSMEKLRIATDAGGMKTCGNLMRQHQTSAKTLRQQAEALPPSRLQSALEVATTDLNFCVSCSESMAKRSCDNVRSSLKDAQSAISSKN